MFSYHLEIFESIDSTHTYLKKELQERGFSYRCIMAYEQINGIGRKANTSWVTNKGQSFILSFSYKIDKALCKEWELSYFIALVLGGVLKNLGISYQIKWPNDIYIENKKVLGILIEKIKDYYLIGIGVNLNQKEFEESLKDTAISLFNILKKPTEPLLFFDLFKRSFESLEKSWQHGEINFVKEIETHLYALNEMVRITQIDNDNTVEGILKGISPTTGALMVEEKMPQKRMREIYAGSLRKC
jgi:BirA family biotin operon repressor/biotin-[acetyl-CoA-carboxylase] ligase